jgi:hypothetical protein
MSRQIRLVPAQASSEARHCRALKTCAPGGATRSRPSAFFQQVRPFLLPPTRKPPAADGLPNDRTPTPPSDHHWFPISLALQYISQPHDPARRAVPRRGRTIRTSGSRAIPPARHSGLSMSQSVRSAAARHRDRHQRCRQNCRQLTVRNSGGGGPDSLVWPTGRGSVRWSVTTTDLRRHPWKIVRRPRHGRCLTSRLSGYAHLAGRAWLGNRLCRDQRRGGHITAAVIKT